MEQAITVSVIIPTYKRSTFYLGRAVNSVLSQTYSHVEIIVVDDSPAEFEGRRQIAEYMQEICAEHKNVIYVQNETNMGGSRTRNRGIELCHGQYVTFLDDDDEYKPEKVEKQLRFMLEQNCDMSFSNMIMYDTNGNIVDYRDHRKIQSFDNAYLLKYHLARKITGTPTYMYKTESLRGIGGFEVAKMGQEFYLMLKTIEKGLKIRYLDDCDVIVYKHQDGCVSEGPNKINGENAVYARVKSYFDRFSLRERMFIRFRHWAVMTVAYRRNKKPLQMLMAGIMAFVVSPVDFFCEVGGFLTKVLKKRQAK